MPAHLVDVKKDAEKSALEKAVSFYYMMKHYQKAGIGLSIGVVLLPIGYVLQGGPTAGFWLLGASLAGAVISQLRRPNYFGSGSFGSDSEFRGTVEKHKKGIRSGSKSWVLAILSPVYVLVTILVIPYYSYDGFLPRGDLGMLFMSGLYLVCVYSMIGLPEVLEAANMEKISRYYNVSEKTLRKRLQGKYPLAPRTLSINFLAGLLYAIGGSALIYGIIWMAFWMIGTPDPIFGTLQGAFLALIIFGPITLFVGHELRKMNKEGGAAAILLALVTAFLLSFAILLLNQLGPLPKPYYINLVWVWGIPFIICIIVWRNWKRMRWTEKFMREWSTFSGKQLKHEKEAPEELTE